MDQVSVVDCPVIPVAVCNTSKLFEDHKPIVKKAPVVIEFGEPVQSFKNPSVRILSSHECSIS